MPRLLPLIDLAALLFLGWLLWLLAERVVNTMRGKQTKKEEDKKEIK